MEHTTTQVHGINPEDLTKAIVEGVKKAIKEHRPLAPNEKGRVYLTRKQVRERLNVCNGTLDKWHINGLLKKRKLGNRVYYLQCEIEQILEEPFIQ